MVAMSRDLRTSTLARFGAVIVGLSFVVFIVGIFPNFFSLDFTGGFGILQIAFLLMGLSFMTLGAYVYMYATRHRAQPPRLREDIGLRLMATGIVIAWATGMADVIGIGTHFGQQRPFFGPVQAWGVAVGVMMIVAGIGLYSQKSQ